jgi:hypothetical protein
VTSPLPSLSPWHCGESGVSGLTGVVHIGYRTPHFSDNSQVTGKEDVTETGEADALLRCGTAPYPAR